MELLPVAAHHGPMAPALGGIGVKFLSSLLGTGSRTVVPLEKGAVQTASEAEAWRELGGALRDLERELLDTVPLHPFGGEVMRFEAFTGEAALQILPEGQFSTCVVTDGCTRAVVYEGPLGKGVGERALEARDDPGHQEFDACARVCITLLRCNGAWRLQEVERGDFALVLRVAPIFYPESAWVNPGPMAPESTEAHLNREITMQRVKRTYATARKRLKLPKLRVQFQTGGSMQQNELDGAPMQGRRDRRASRLLQYVQQSPSGSKSLPQLRPLSHTSSAELSRPESKVSFRWMEDNDVSLSLDPTRASGCPPSRTASAATVQDISEQGNELLRRNRIAAMSHEHRRELLFGAHFQQRKDGRKSKTAVINTPIGCRIKALEKHIFRSD